MHRGRNFNGERTCNCPDNICERKHFSLHSGHHLGQAQNDQPMTRGWGLGVRRKCGAAHLGWGGGVVPTWLWAQNQVKKGPWQRRRPSQSAQALLVMCPKPSPGTGFTCIAVPVPGAVGSATRQNSACSGAYGVVGG